MQGGSLAVVEQAVSVLNKVQEYIDTGMTTTMDICSDVLDTEKDAVSVESRMGEMTEIMQQFAEMDQELKRFVAATKHAKEFVRNDGNVQEMENALDRKLKQLKEQEADPKEHRKCQELAAKIEEMRNAGQEGEEEEEEDVEAPTLGPGSMDDDMSITQGEISTKCPYTGQDMQNPVKNKICGHYYDKAGVQEMCKKRSRAKCPIPGCPNVRPLSMDDVEEDKAMKKYILAKGKRTTKKGKK